MHDSSSAFIVLEGSDGSGKTTQLKLLGERLKAVGYEVVVFDFPRYEHASSYFVKQYLNGKYGPASKISPYSASLFYALDRFEAANEIREALAENKVVLCNRFSGSNMAHQGSKFQDPLEQRSFFVWEDSLEFQLLNIPRPSINIFLRVPPDISYRLIGERQKRSYTDRTYDEHEKDRQHLKKSVATYDLLCQLFPNDFKAIECTDGRKLLDVPTINNLIWEAVRPFLPARPTMPAHSVTVKLDGPSTAKDRAKTKNDGDHLSLTNLELSLAMVGEIEAVAAGTLRYESSWHKNGYSYFIPENLPKKVRQIYVKALDALAGIHSDMFKKRHVDENLLLPVTPLAARVKTGLKMTADQTAKVLGRLAKLPQDEASVLAGRIKAEASRLWPDNAEIEIGRPTGREPERLSNILSKIAEAHLPQNNADQSQRVQLLEAWPRNEFNILTDMIYPYSNLPRSEIDKQLEQWSYQRKYETLSAGLDNKTESATEQVQYRFDITADRVALRELEKSGMAAQIKTQPPTPRYGYEVPAEIDNVGITDEYLECFDKSLELFSALQATGKDELSAYATLLGHKTRFQILCPLDSLRKQNPDNMPSPLRQLYSEMVEKISEHHPIIGSQLSETRAKRSAMPVRGTPRAKRGGVKRPRGGKAR